ncbi:hypothetical protein [Thermanaeromonas sp. C210]|uniref:hypothetical protein n=1 Tax=Thermanaeromonas sp. C210 TaxID=2731925 RepID=UPI00155BFB58|nr:hypothetical protein [Thermanaeromonas sp. C210]GFN23735.1 hypothetical protein TAMC210_20520 [Thermanaeromonas sp. C210]
MPLLWTLEDDIWNITSGPGWLNYAYILTGRPVAGIAYYLSSLDPAGRLHLLLRTAEGRNIYVYWQGRSWQTLSLPCRDGEEPYGLVVDGTGRKHILLRLGPGRVKHLLYQGGDWLIRELPFTLPPEPLCFALEDSERLFLCWEEVTGGMKILLSSTYTRAAGWSPPCIIGQERKEAGIYFYGPEASRLYWLVWKPQGGSYGLYYYTRQRARRLSRKEYLGEVLELPDRAPVRLILGSATLLCWTAKGKFTFCLRESPGTTWSKVQTDYLFFPACLEAVAGWPDLRRDKIAFTKICGLDLQWPLILTAEQILPYCRALVSRG